METKDFIELITLLSKIFNKYNLKELTCNIFESHPMIDNRIVDKDLLHIRARDVHGFIINDSKVDI